MVALVSLREAVVRKALLVRVDEVPLGALLHSQKLNPGLRPG
jgi:hypothetical protein